MHDIDFLVHLPSFYKDVLTILWPGPDSFHNNKLILMKLGMNIMPQWASHPGLETGVDAGCLVPSNFFNIIYSA
jgi:hypothetical protein